MAYYGQTMSRVVTICRLQTFANALSNASNAYFSFFSPNGDSISQIDRQYSQPF